jgi:hypothetical protein
LPDGGQSGAGKPNLERQRVKIDVLTLFPEMFAGPLDVSIVARARKAGVAGPADS